MSQAAVCSHSESVAVARRARSVVSVSGRSQAKSRLSAGMVAAACMVKIISHEGAKARRFFCDRQGLLPAQLGGEWCIGIQLPRLFTRSLRRRSDGDKACLSMTGDRLCMKPVPSAESGEGKANGRGPGVSRHHLLAFFSARLDEMPILLSSSFKACRSQRHTEPRAVWTMRCEPSASKMAWPSPSQPT